MRRVFRCLLVGLGLVVAVRCASSPPAKAAAAASLESAPLQYASQEGRRVAYRVLGQGEPAIVFVHGWTCDMTSWSKQVPFFAASHRVVTIDLPGHGASDKPEIAYTMDLFARAVDAVLREAGVSRAVLVGHSMGTPVVRQFYRLFPGKTVALVAVDGSLKPFTLDPAAVEKFLAPFRGPDFRQNQERMVDSMLPQSDPSVREAMKAVMLAAPQHVLVSAGQSMFDPAIWKDDPIGVPLLCVLAKSPFWSAEYETFVHKLARRLDYRVWDGVGHFLMLEKPDAFNSLLDLFVAHPPTR